MNTKRLFFALCLLLVSTVSGSAQEPGEDFSFPDSGKFLIIPVRVYSIEGLSDPDFGANGYTYIKDSPTEYGYQFTSVIDPYLRIGSYTPKIDYIHHKELVGTGGYYALEREGYGEEFSSFPDHHTLQWVLELRYYMWEFEDGGEYFTWMAILHTRDGLDQVLDSGGWDTADPQSGVNREAADFIQAGITEYFYNTGVITDEDYNAVTSQTP